MMLNIEELVPSPFLSSKKIRGYHKMDFSSTTHGYWLVLELTLTKRARALFRLGGEILM